jgi:ribosome-binding factor A
MNRGKRDYPRSARLGELLRQIIAEEIEGIDDDRLDFVGIAGVDVDNDLFQANVWFSTLDLDNSGYAEVQAALDDHKGRIKSAIGRQTRVRRVPNLTFGPDPSILAGERVESILRDIDGDPDSGEESR